MTIEQAIKTFLATKTGITNLVSTRIYLEGHLPQSPTYPSLSFFKVSGFRHHDIDVASPRFQFDCWALTKTQSIQLADEVISALQRERNVLSGIEVIQGVYLNEFDLDEPDTKIYHRAVDFKIIYREA